MDRSTNRHLLQLPNGVRISVQIKPQSRETRLILEADGTVKLQVQAPAEKGKANREIIRWFAKKLKRPTSHVRIVTGIHSKTKIIEILNVNTTDVEEAFGQKL